MRFRSHFEGKKITVMGLGLLGRGVGDARFLAQQGAELIVTDLKSREELATSLAELAAFPNITYVLGEHRLEDFRNRDYILKAAGVPLDSPYIAEARAAGIPIKMSASWFAELAQIPVIGITGTRGKSTTTHMIHAVLKEAQIPVLLGGNVRGVSTLALLDTVTEGDYALFELDSWQCQGFGEERMSPHIAVFTTFMRDHMNYYHDDMGAYLEDKAQIFKYQTSDDTLVLGAQCASRIEETYGDTLAATVVHADAHTIPAAWTLQIPGEHNRYNAGLAYAVGKVLGLTESVLERALTSFAGVPGRLERVGVVQGVTVYNDTTATTPDATLAALDALPANSTVLIMGGADKGLQLERLAERVRTLKSVVLLAGTGTDRLLPMLGETVVCTSLAEAVSHAFAQSAPGDTLVLSPAFASFGMFKNEYDRGDQFMSIINSYGG